MDPDPDSGPDPQHWLWVRIWIWNTCVNHQWYSSKARLNSETLCLAYSRIIMWMPRDQTNQFHGTSLHQSWAWHLRHSLQTLAHQPVQAGGSSHPFCGQPLGKIFRPVWPKKSCGWGKKFGPLVVFTSFGHRNNILLCQWRYLNKKISANFFWREVLKEYRKKKFVLLLSCCGLHIFFFSVIMGTVGSAADFDLDSGCTESRSESWIRIKGNVILPRPWRISRLQE